MTYLNEALKFQGTPYKMGGMDKSGMDCSGLVNAATGQKTRVWHTGSGAPPPGDWVEMSFKKNSTDEFAGFLKKGDLLLWEGHVAFFFEGVQLFHARRMGTVVGFTNDLKLYWLKEKGYPIVYRQN